MMVDHEMESEEWNEIVELSEDQPIEIMDRNRITLMVSMRNLSQTKVMNNQQLSTLVPSNESQRNNSNKYPLLAKA
jgi:spore germination protein YaaH